MGINVTKENFSKEILSEEKLVILDFFATWCMPCQMLTPILEEISEEYKDKVKVCKVNVDEEQDIATEFKIMNIPTLVFLRNGKVVNTVVGLRSKSELESIINSI